MRNLTAGGAAWADFDRDGDLDLFVANDQSESRLYANTLGVRSPTVVVNLRDQG